MPFQRIASQTELPENDQAKEFSVGEKVLCVTNCGGVFSAMDNICVHRGGPLGQGVIEEGKLVCPWHGWQYDPKTGQVAHDPRAKVNVYPLKIEGGDVLVDV